jgi:hypothetical protein
MEDMNINPWPVLQLPKSGFHPLEMYQMATGRSKNSITGRFLGYFKCRQGEKTDTITTSFTCQQFRQTEEDMG